MSIDECPDNHGTQRKFLYALPFGYRSGSVKAILWQYAIHHRGNRKYCLPASGRLQYCNQETALCEVVAVKLINRQITCSVVS